MESIRNLTDLAKFIDHTRLSADTQESHIFTLCEEARAHHFYAVCINPFYVPLARKTLQGSNVKIATVCGFPLGANQTVVKIYEAERAVNEGADEIDMVLNIGALKDGRDAYVQDEIAKIKHACGHAVLKVIVETSLLNEAELVRACRLSVEGGANFVKTSTGFSTSGANETWVRLMRKTVGPDVGVKASGGIRDLGMARTMLEAGANRLGTSASVSLITELQRGLDAGH